MQFAEYLEKLRAIYAREEADPAFGPGASNEELSALENALGFEPSAALSDAWRIANGSDTPALSRPGYFTGYDLLSTQSAIATRAAMKQRAPNYADYTQPAPRQPRIRDGWYQDGWLPFASFGGATLLLIEDHAPGEGGTVGQIIGFVHDPDEMVWVADSFEVLLDASLAQIDADPYEYGIGDE